MAPTATPQLNDRIVRPAEAAAYLGFKSRQSCYDLVREGKLPKPIKVTSRMSGWRASTLEAFLSQREALLSPEVGGTTPGGKRTG